MALTVYTIYINGAETHTDLSEDEFLDIMDDYAYSYYQTGRPHPDRISHTMKELNHYG
jgi:hypothetical protein